MPLTDTHCHLEAKVFAGDLGKVARHALEHGVERLVAVGVSPEDFPAQRQAMDTVRAEGLPVLPAFGSHPWWADRVDPETAIAALDRLWLGEETPCDEPAMVAVGEVGLDFAADVEPDRQNALFVAQLDWAGAHGLPVILHERKSADRLLYWLRRHRHAGGVVHGFVGSVQQAKQFIDEGFFIGVGGAVTHPGAHRVHRMIRQLPLEALVLETDAPNQPGHAHRGERNLPGYLPENLDALARLRDMEIGELAAVIDGNTARLFGLPADCAGA
ncbi:TatD family hydrolase [Guyparkeria sp.]|uniref:TatD family hydrolase n=1 Tax=Guyparkeria sp. TaxID=2035736 RepID=UPI003563B4EE